MTTPTPALAASRRGRAERWVSGVTVSVAVTAVVATAGTATVLAAASAAQTNAGQGSSASAAGTTTRPAHRTAASQLQQFFGQVNPLGSGGGQAPTTSTTGS